MNRSVQLIYKFAFWGMRVPANLFTSFCSDKWQHASINENENNASFRWYYLWYRHDLETRDWFSLSTKRKNSHASGRKCANVSAGTEIQKKDETEWNPPSKQTVYLVDKKAAKQATKSNTHMGNGRHSLSKRSVLLRKTFGTPEYWTRRIHQSCTKRWIASNCNLFSLLKKTFWIEDRSLDLLMKKHTIATSNKKSLKFFFRLFPFSTLRVAFIWSRSRK